MQLSITSVCCIDAPVSAAAQAMKKLRGCSVSTEVVGTHELACNLLAAVAGACHVHKRVSIVLLSLLAQDVSDHYDESNTYTCRCCCM